MKNEGKKKYCIDVPKFRQLQLKLLREFVRICQKHDLRYYLGFGTLLGAVRHKGFIPWDDDIDVCMPYPDMLKLEKICGDLGQDYFYQSNTTDPEFTAWLARLRLNNTTQKEAQFVGKNIHHGVFIDIFPLYGVAPTKYKRFIQLKNAMLSSLFLWQEPVRNHGLILKLGSAFLLKIIPQKYHRKLYERNFTKLTKYAYDDSKYVRFVTSSLKTLRTYYLRDWYGQGIKMKFEDIEAVIPVEYDKILKTLYGDYMVLPPKKKQCFHHNFIELDLERGVAKKNK